MRVIGIYIELFGNGLEHRANRYKTGIGFRAGSGFKVRWTGMLSRTKSDPHTSSVNSVMVTKATAAERSI